MLVSCKWVYRFKTKKVKIKVMLNVTKSSQNICERWLKVLSLPHFKKEEAQRNIRDIKRFNFEFFFKNACLG